jgi:hypothetical protein
LLGYGVPAESLDDVRNATEDTLLELADHLPSEAAEALLDLATFRRKNPSCIFDRAKPGASLFASAD